MITKPDREYVKLLSVTLTAGLDATEEDSRLHGGGRVETRAWGFSRTCRASHNSVRCFARLRTSRGEIRRAEKKGLLASRNRQVHLIRLEHPGIITACLIRLFIALDVMSSFLPLSSYAPPLLVPSDSSIVGTSRSPAPAANG